MVSQLFIGRVIKGENYAPYIYLTHDVNNKNARNGSLGGLAINASDLQRRNTPRVVRKY